MTNNEFIQYVANIAVKDWSERKIMLPSVVIAQAILESGWGTTELAQNANALFGIKKNGWTGKVYIKVAAEQRPDGSYYTVDNTEWRAYGSWEESIIDHNNYIATREISAGVLRYKKIIANADYKEVCQLLKECGYATSLTYSEKLTNLIDKYNLTQYDVIEEALRVIKIALDAGHGINTAGKRCMKKLDPNETREWVLNSRIANKLEALLKSYSCEVLRVDDVTGVTDISNTNRANRANAWGADIYISIHHDAGLNGRDGGGTTVYYSSSKPERPVQSQALYDAVVAQTGLVGNRSTKVIKKGFTVIAKTSMPAFLIENGFMDSPTDVPIILSEAHANKTAQGVLNFLVSEWKLNKVTEPEVEVEAESGTIYRVQCGAFKNKSYAESLRDKLKADGYEALIVTK